MKNQDLFYQYNPWWEEAYKPKDIISRPKFQKKLESMVGSKTVVFLTGLRRVGKTTLMKMLIQHLLDQGVESKHILYISLDDYQLKDMNIFEILTEYRKIHRLTYDTKSYVFFDEVTSKNDFRLQFKNIYDNQNTKIFASSSSSSALKDKKGFLTGREQNIEIAPLDFEEFLAFRNITLQKRDSALKNSYFEEYLKCGGMPEYVLNQNRGYLTGLIDDILNKDIVAFHAIKNSQIIKDYFMLLMERAGKQISINKVANILNISPDSARRYLHMFEDTYLIYLVSRHGKTNEQILSPKKIYAADLGIRNIFTGFRDKGTLFENFVYSIIKPLDPHYVYENGIEIDFFTNNKILIEVKYGKELNAKQLELFESFKANKKIIIKNFEDLELAKNIN